MISLRKRKLEEGPLNTIYDEYKPLRNFLRKLEVLNSLGSIRWYVMYNQLPEKPDILQDMNVGNNFIQNPLRFFPPWSAAILAREIIIESDGLGKDRDLREWQNVAHAMKKLSCLDDAIARNFIGKENVLHYVSKVLSHQQFVWQDNWPNLQTLSRYFYIYSHPTLKPIFEDYFGMSILAYFVLSVLLWGNFMNNLGIDYPPTLKLKKFAVSIKEYDKYMVHYSLPFAELKERLRSERNVDKNFFNYFDSLREFPLIKTVLNGKESHICPVPTYLFWRTTDGIFYNLADQKGFGAALGDAYEAYIGQVICEKSNGPHRAFVDANEYISSKLPKPDWIYTDREGSLFIECKAKRMRLGAKIDQTYSSTTESEIKVLAECVVQCYKAIQNAMNKDYGILQGKQVPYPVVVTLESWYIFGDIGRKLKPAVHQLATKEGVDLKLLKEKPYLVLSSREFEDLMATLSTNSISQVLEPFFNEIEYKDWSLISYLQKAFRKDSTGYTLFEKNLLDDAIAEASAAMGN